ncbi:hypothetical protein BDA99DRAFT_594277 [Phascolomyces articulosus]|uniref:Uncharacterized protein n=1 Tax=Phascolomyces articulosus TaxID=60185 RepID=A0AAD5JLC0_9FUNG|nr:hypothetical protein BDA99DRAFT_594277 [Phascolomyces articulosus]
MIGYAPTSPARYCFKGNLLSINGYEILAIKAYDGGIQNTVNDDKLRDIMSRRKKQKYRNAKSKTHYHYGLSPIRPIYPLKYCSNGWMEVSIPWRRRILHCTIAWEILSVYDESNNNDGFQSLQASVIKHVSHNVKCPMIATENEAIIHPTYLQILSKRFVS